MSAESNPSRRRSLRRIVVLGALAFLLYGSWAVLANWGRGQSVLLRAFLVQGCSSAFVTSTVAFVIEWVHARLPRTTASASLAVVVGVLFAAIFHITSNLIAATPEVLRTVAVPILANVVYATVYVVGLRAAARALPTERS